MVFFGGSDPSNETAKAVKALQMLSRSDIEADIIVGIANPHRAEVERLCALSPTTHYHCQVSNMADFMLRADLALGAGGSTTWERCCLGLPALTVIIAKNQAEMTTIAAKHGLQWSLGESAHLSAEELRDALAERIATPDEIREYSQRSQDLVSGNGAQLIMQHISNYAGGAR
jgi:UDP-2,4-diacetamido-2,4,6-trideoxy-beta-L-altropyranose hydrolase